MASTYVSGTVKWFKMLGEPRMDELQGRKVWSFNFYPDDQAAMDRELKVRKINKTMKDKGDPEGRFLTLGRNELTKAGNKNKPVPIVDADGKAWDQNKLVGNDSKVTIRYTLNTESKYGNIMWLEGVRIDDYVEYVSDLFPDAKAVDEAGWEDEEEEVVVKPTKRKRPVVDEDLDDDVPF